MHKLGKRGREGRGDGKGTWDDRERGREGEKAFLGRSPAAAVATSEEGGREAPSFSPLGPGLQK